MQFRKWVCVLGLALMAGSAMAQDKNEALAEQGRFFTLATGYSNGIYYLFGTIIGALASSPVGGLACEVGGHCGAEQTTIVNLSSQGSQANLALLQEGKVDSAFVQSNLAYWAYTATALYDKKPPQENLRAIASFYPELLHLVVPADSGISSLADLRGKRVGMGAKDSGTLINVYQMLKAFDLEEGAFTPSFLSLRETLAQFENGELDAFFFVGGVPTPAIAQLADKMAIDLIALDGAFSDDLLTANSANNYYTQREIPAGAYRGVNKAVPTLAVMALWLTTETADKEQVYAMTKAIWTQENHPYWVKQLLPVGGLEMSHALDGIGIPLHAGAKRYYNEVGKRF